jgi:hypothetical protein
MKSYDIALIVTIEADSYDDALKQAEDLAEGVGDGGENISVVRQYNRDNENWRSVDLPKSG